MNEYALESENARLKAELAAAQKDAFRAGMLAAADVLKQQFYKTQDECEQAIREAAKS